MLTAIRTNGATGNSNVPANTRSHGNNDCGSNVNNGRAAVKRIVSDTEDQEHEEEKGEEGSRGKRKTRRLRRRSTLPACA